MKILTLTTHNVHNYGAVLQSFALQQYIKSLGYETQILDYKPNYFNKSLFIWDKKQPLFKKILTNSIALPSRYFRSLKFNKFVKEELDLYKLNNDLQSSKNLIQADVFIVGSDQIWNPDITDGVDENFYLNFVNDGKKISYAASFGKYYVDQKYSTEVQTLLNKFDAISVREKSGKSILEDLGIKESNVTIDPVFLLQQKDYNEILEKPEVNRYLLIYTLENNNEISSFAKYIAEKKNLKIVSIGSFLNRYESDIHYRSAGPRQFLGLIKNAEFVITNSFHATTFSILFNVPFAAVSLNNNRGTRIENLLEICNLENRVFSNLKDKNKMLEEINYEEVEKKLKVEIEKSKRFLLNNI